MEKSDDNKKVLFICKHNIFRSRVAEEYLKKISTYDVSSAGLIKGDKTLQSQIDIAKELYDINISYNAKSLSIAQLKEQDIVIVVAADVPKGVFNNPVYELDGKVEFWGIEDCDDLFTPTKDNIKAIITTVVTKVEELNKRLGGENGKE